MYKHNRQTKKTTLLILSVLLLTCTAIGATIAYIKSTADPIENTFTPARVSCEVSETFNGKLKKNTAIKNTGNVSAYIRATVAVTWQTETQTNEILALSPKENVNYKVTIGDARWNRGEDGYWYYSDAVPPNALTEPLFALVEPLGEAPAGYKLSFNVICEAIQSDPERAVLDAWNVSVIDGYIIPSA